MAEITLTIKCSNETRVQVKINPSGTVSDLKEKIAEELSSTSIPTPAQQQRLIYAGRVLKDEEILSTYKIGDGHTIHMVRQTPKPAAAATSTPTSTNSSTTTTTTTSTTSSSTTPTSPRSTTTNTTTPATGGPFGAGATNPLGGGFGLPPTLMGSGYNPFFNNPLLNPGAAAQGGAAGAAGAGAGGFPGMSGMDPNMVSQLMSNPAFASSMSQLFANPQFLDSMIASNPNLAGMMTPEVRQMMQSEEFRRMLSDPNMVRTALSMGPYMNMFGGGAGAGAGAGAGFGGAGTGLGSAGAGGAIANPWVSGGVGTTPTDTTRSAEGTTPTGAATTPAAGQPASPFGMMNPAFLQMMMGGMPGAGFPGTTPAAPAGPPEEIYQVQLRQLQDMGFYDAVENVRALTLTAGNVEAAIEYLLSNPPVRR